MDKLISYILCFLDERVNKDDCYQTPVCCCFIDVDKFGDRRLLIKDYTKNGNVKVVRHLSETETDNAEIYSRCNKAVIEYMKQFE